MRDNPDLDTFMNEPAGDVDGARLPKQKRRKAGVNKDTVRRLAFRVLATLANHDAGDRERVLRFALKINRAT
jgi:hypothetical protein